MTIKHNRGELLTRLRQLEEDPAATMFVRMALIVSLTDEQLCEIVNTALEALEIHERLSGRFPSHVEDAVDGI